MDWLQFIAAVLVGYAWPSVLIALLLILRKQIPALFERIEEASFGGSKLKFDKAVDAVRGQFETIDPEVRASEVKKPIAQPGDPFLALANESPEAAILDSWREVEAALVEMYPYLGLPTKRRDAQSVLEELLHDKYVDENVLSLFKSLQGLRDMVSGGYARPTPGQALDVRLQVRSLVEVLRRAFDRWQRDPKNEGRPFEYLSNKPTLQEKREAQLKNQGEPRADHGAHRASLADTARLMG